MSRENNNDNLCWFHENITREAAEALIEKEGTEDGTFLVRESTTAVGDFVLTLLYQGEVCHYQIRRHGEDAFFSIDDKVRILHGLETLVNFYKEDSHGLVTKLTKHIKKDLPPNHTRSQGVTNLLHRATKENNRTVVTEMLKCGYRNVDAKNQFGQTALHLAAIHCDETILALLLAAGVSVNVMDTYGNMPLHYASRNKSANFIRTLLEANANVQGRNINNGYVPLHEAAKHGNIDAVIELLAANAPLLPRTKDGEFPIDLAKEQLQTAVVDYLTNYKVPAAKTSRTHWYHGTLNREESVATLKDFADNTLQGVTVGDADADRRILDKSGFFLVRYSEKNKSSGYVLTLLWNEQVKHYQILQSSKYLYIDEGPYLPSLEHLVEHFMRFADGLPVSLKYPVKPKPKPPVPLFSTMPRSGRKASEGSLVSPTKPLQVSSTPLSGNERATDVRTQFASQTLGHKKTTHSVFNTLKKSKFDMNSLRISKTKLKSLEKQQTLAEPVQKKDPPSILENLSFELDLVTVPTEGNASEHYNVPQNNSAVLENTEISSYQFDNKTEEEVEYLTKSDIIIAKERLERMNNVTNGLPNTNEETAIGNVTDYVPTMDVRVFMDPILGEVQQEISEALSADLRLISKHPERLDSVMSTISTESAVNRFFQRQGSAASTATLSGEPSAAQQINYFIPRECLELSEIIGEGEFAVVYKGWIVRAEIKEKELPEIRCPVAIKTLRDEHCRADKEQFLREASVMNKLQHHCIVKLIGISKGETLMMVQEFVPLGSMLQFIYDNHAHINPNYELKLWASQIACGMEYLESQHFVHRDLAARNILLASRNQAKISDFGLSRALAAGNDAYEATQGGKWPIKWYAPESYTNGIFSHASDVWSFGVTLWEMFSFGEVPYGDKRSIEVIELINQGKRLPKPAACPEHVYEIMQNCWNYKPKDRPAFGFLTEFFGKDPDYQNIMELIKTEHIS